MHCRTSFHISVVRLLQVVVNHLDCMQCQRISIIAVQGGYICLNRMCHSVHTSMCNQLFRHSFCQFRIYNGNVRRDIKVSQRILNTLVIVRNYRKCSYFCRSTRCRRNCTKFCLCPQCREAKRCNDFFKCSIRILIEYPHCLCSVNRRATTHGNDPIRLEFPHCFCTLHYGFYRRIRFNAFKQLHFHAGFFQISHRLVQKAKPLHGTTANNYDCFFASQRF